MSKIEKIEDFYKNKFNWMPDNVRNELGHFKVFRLEPFAGDEVKPVPYKRRDFYYACYRRKQGSLCNI